MGCVSQAGPGVGHEKGSSCLGGIHITARCDERPYRTVPPHQAVHRRLYGPTTLTDTRRRRRCVRRLAARPVGEAPGAMGSKVVTWLRNCWAAEGDPTGRDPGPREAADAGLCVPGGRTLVHLHWSQGGIDLRSSTRHHRLRDRDRTRQELTDVLRPGVRPDQHAGSPHHQQDLGSGPNEGHERGSHWPERSPGPHDRQLHHASPLPGQVLLHDPERAQGATDRVQAPHRRAGRHRHRQDQDLGEPGGRLDEVAETKPDAASPQPPPAGTRRSRRLLLGTRLAV